MKLTPVLSKNWADAKPWTVDGYGGGYASARKALTTMDPDAVIATVKESGLRGRGGAGTGRRGKTVTRRVIR